MVVGGPGRYIAVPTHNIGSVLCYYSVG
jgi:hypothetical protein